MRTSGVLSSSFVGVRSSGPPRVLSDSGGWLGFEVRTACPGDWRERGPAASPYGEAECREDGGERGERDVDVYAPAVLAFLGHKGLGWFGGFMSRQNMP